jgi:uncharacterized protein YjdB
MNQLEIVINPYENTTRFTINNKPVSPYSELANYSKEPFYLWGDKVLDSISRELNDEFELIIVSRNAEADIMKGLSHNHDDCVAVIHKNLVIDTSVSNRFKMLQDIIITNKINLNSQEVFINLFCYDTITLERIVQYFNNEKKVVACNERDNKYYCDDYPLCNITICIDEYSEERYEAEQQNINVILVADESAAKAVYNEIKRYNGHSTILVLNNTNNVEKCKNVFICSCDERDLITNFFELLEFRYLIPILIKNYNDLKASLSNDMLVDNFGIAEQIRMVSSVEPFVSLQCVSQLELNTFSPLIIKTHPENMEIPKLYVKCSTENVISYDGKNIMALSVGETDVEAYVQGGLEPIAKFHISVIQRNRTKEIILDNANYVMGVQDVLKLSCNILPENADDQDLLKWTSTDENIAIVDDNGNVLAKKIGTCYIVLSIEDISASCLISVKPKISNINLSQNEIHLYIGEISNISVEIYPTDVINNETFWEISDSSVVNLEDGIIKAKGIGKATITVYTADRSVSNSCQIKVASTFDKKEYRNTPLSASVIAFIISIFVSGISSINLIVPIAGVILGLFAIQRNKKDSGTAIVFIILNIAVLASRFLNLFNFLQTSGVK